MNINSSLIAHSWILWTASLLIILILVVWVASLQSRVSHLHHSFDDVFAGVQGENMGQMLAEYLITVRQTARVVENVKAEHDELARLAPAAIRHVGLIRFSPFQDTGGDQSFALALLDSEQNGVIVTALHSRTDSRLYAKPVVKGQSSYTLSPEERTAVQQAVHGNVRQTV